MEPEPTKNEAKIETNALKRPTWLPDGSPDHFRQEVSSILTIFGVSSRTPKSTKNCIFVKQGPPQEGFFVDFRGCFGFPHFYGHFWSVFYRKIDDFFIVIFRSLSHFFQHGDPHETLLFIYREPLFHFFIFYNFHQNLVKNCKKNDPRKIIKKRPLRGPILAPKITKMGRGGPQKSPRMAKKLVF